jgi:hypothetical protein
MLDLLTEIFKGITSIILYFWWLFALLFVYFAWQNRRKTEFVEKIETIVMEIKIPKTNDKGATAAEMMFATLHGILKPKSELIKRGEIQEHISFELVSDNAAIRFFVWAPKHLKDFIEGQIYAQYPSAEISVCDDYTEKINFEKENFGYHVSGAEIELTKADYLPVKTFNNFEVDPLAGITGVLSKLEEKNEQFWIQILARPISDEWKQGGLSWIASRRGSSGGGMHPLISEPLRFAADIIKGFWSPPGEKGEAPKIQLSAEEEGMISAIEQKSEKLGYAVKIRVLYLAPDNNKARERMQAIFGAFKQFNTTNLNGFKGRNVLNDKHFFQDYKNRLFLEKGFHLNIEELASIYHMPHTSVETPNISWTSSKKGEPPTELPIRENTEEKDLTVFAETNFRSHRIEFGIKRDDRRRHTYIIGKSGMGKSKLLELMIDSDIKRGEGVAIIDPHGEVITEVLTRIPPERINDVIVFDPADTKNPIAFNPMEVIDPDLKSQLAAGVLGTFKKIFGDSWGPRLEYIFNYTLLALLDTPDTTLIGVVRMLTDKNYRKTIIDNIQDPVVKKFWITEFASYSDKFASEAIAPILNKVGQFIANPLVRNIIGQPNSSFNIRQAMDEGKILLFNLSVGRVGEVNASLLGSFIITSVQLAAMSRADMLEDKRRDFYLYVDEFQNFATESFATILSEARKYRLNLIMANQYVAQMEDVVREAVFGNVGTMITFRVGAADATFLEKEFNPPFEAQDLINLSRQHIYIRETIDGQSGQAFSAKTLDVTRGSLDQVKEILEKSRNKYSRPIEEVNKVVSEYAGIAEGISYKAVEEENLARVAERKGDKRPDKKKEDIAAAIKASTAHLDSRSKKEDIVSKNNSAVATLEQTADYIVRHASGDNKYFYLPENMPKNLVPDAKGRTKGGVYIKGNQKIYDVKVDMYEANPKDFGKEKAPDVWVGSVDELLDQMDAITASTGGGTKFIGIEDNTKDKSILSNKIKDRESTKKQPGTIADKIGKDTLSEILKTLVSPEGESDTEKNNKINISDVESQKISSQTGESTLIKNSKLETRNSDLPEGKSVVSPSSKKEKLITAENFKRVKQIHPHEVVRIAEEKSQPQEIKENETIKFN